MSKLNIDQQTIKQLFSDKRSDFLIPDYQRPYAWGETECQTLWDDIFLFAFPDNDYSKFDEQNDEYFLGPIVTFKNEDGKLEIIDGQQRLTTLMLILRAFYTRFGKMEDPFALKKKEEIATCIWKTDELGRPIKDRLKIDSEVSTDTDKEEFMTILRTGEVQSDNKSRYAKTYRFFQNKIEEFLQDYPSYFIYLPIRILNNCILLPIEAESQDTALRIFSTLNDRGKPLSDTDIFKAQLYKFYADQGQKEEFITRWKDLEALCGEIFNTEIGSPMDELFTRYMYFERAKQRNKNTTTEALRKFYEKNKYEILKRNETLDNLEMLANFWKNVSVQDDSFSDEVLRRLFVLNYAPNGMWTYLVSVYYMTYKDSEGNLENDSFEEFLNKITGFIWAYAIIRPGVNALRSPAYPEMIKIVDKEEVTFNEYKFESYDVRMGIENYLFTNGRPVTKSFLAWWAYNNDVQPLLSLDTRLEIEHIYPRKRQENEKTLQEKGSLESLGNKALLEKKINIRASDYRFEDKKKYYKGYVNAKGKEKEGTGNIELLSMAQNKNDFTEDDIKERKKAIVKSFVEYLKNNDLLLDY